MQKHTIIALIILLISGCVSKKQLDEAMRAERVQQVETLAKMEQKLAQQQLEIGILKD